MNWFGKFVHDSLNNNNTIPSVIGNVASTLAMLMWGISGFLLVSSGVDIMFDIPKTNTDIRMAAFARYTSTGFLIFVLVGLATEALREIVYWINDREGVKPENPIMVTIFGDYYDEIPRFFGIVFTGVVVQILFLLIIFFILRPEIAVILMVVVGTPFLLRESKRKAKKGNNNRRD